MARIAVLGAGGHGQDIGAIARACRLQVMFFDDADDFLLDCGMVGSTPYVVGVNDPVTRRRLAVGSNPVTLVHPTATIDPTSVIEVGCVIAAGTHIGPGCHLGRHVHIGPGCTLTRTRVGEFTTISPGVDIAGDVIVGADCLIGVGSTVRNLQTIGNRVKVGAGAVVTRHVGSDQIVVGVPARPLQRKGAA